MRRTAFSALIILSLAACTSNDRGLRVLDGGAGPDEFGVLPAAPLELPESFETLPQPTPGAANRTDPNPTADAIAVLGGRSGANVAGGVPASDRALVVAAGRNGVDPSIRETLASEDATFRTRVGRFGLFNRGDRYFQAYSRQALDAYAELQRFRNAGVATPSAPPRN